MVRSVLDEKKKLLCFVAPYNIDAVRSGMKAEQEESYSKADLSKQKWNGSVSGSQHSIKF